MANLIGSGRIVETRGNTSVTIKTGGHIGEVTLACNCDGTVQPGALIHIYDDATFILGDTAPVAGDAALPVSNSAQDVNC